MYASDNSRPVDHIPEYDFTPHHNTHPFHNHTAAEEISIFLQYQTISLKTITHMNSSTTTITVTTLTTVATSNASLLALSCFK